MVAGIAKLKRMIGKHVRSVSVELVFFGVEQEGDIGDVSIVFRNGSHFMFGCAGDGSVLVSLCRNEIGDSPYTTTIRQEIPGLSGELSEVVSDGNRIRLRLDDSIFVLINSDDQLEIELDGASILKEICMKR